MKRHNLSNDTETGPAARPRPLWVRALMLGITWTLVLQPSVATGAIAQEPLFSVTAVPPNVMLIADDSNSMREYTLPLPSGIALPSPNCRSRGTGFPIDGVRVNSRIGTNTCVHLDDDWALRAPALNPLWYNPAVTYTPWNDNNKPAASNFPQANWGGSTSVADPAQLTQWDMRKWPASVNPFYTPSLTPVTTNTGTIGSAAQVVNPSAGRYVRYPGMPGEGPAGEDLFTGSVGFTCNLCLTYNQVPVYGPLPPCLAYAQDPVYGPLPPCLAYFQVPVYGPAPPCLEYQQDPVYGPLPPCLAFQQIPVITCVLVPDAGEESGFRQVCSVTGYVDGPCINQPPAPIIGYVNGVCINQPLGPLLGYVDGACSNQPPPAIIGYVNGACIDQPPAPIIDYVNGTCQTFNPADATCPLANRVFVPGGWAPARYFRFDGTPGQENLPNKYTLVDIDRTVNLGAMFPVVDAVTGQPAATRTDCANSASCTWVEEAKNFANFYTYYRNRLFAAMAVTSQVLSNATDSSQTLRFGFGRINRFPDAPVPWDPPTSGNVGSRFVGTPNIDGNTTASPTAVERGVRPFTVGSPERQQVFDWLFGLQWTGSTPNREALYSAGAYFARSSAGDTRNPFAEDPAVGEPLSQNLWCRRNFTLLATDGEWTKVKPPGVVPQPQPTLEDGAVDGIDITPINTGAPFGDVTDIDSLPGPIILGSNRKNPADIYSYQYVPAGAGAELWFSGGASADTYTLTDVAKYFWANDLRPDLANRFDRDLPTKKAFWQHMVNYIVGYGVKATMDDAANRALLNTRTGSVDWPPVGPEECRIVDLDSDPVNTTIGGCGVFYPPLTAGYGHRTNDTFRAAVASEGNFYAAANPEQLRASIKSVLSEILADPASGTAPSVSNTAVATGNLIIESSFRTDIWDGKVEAFDTKELVDWLISGGTKPAPKWAANFPALSGDRNIYTAETRTQVREFKWAQLTTAQKTALDSFSETSGAPDSPILQWLRGEPSTEQRNGGALRNRPLTILGDIVNSSPQYSKATDHAYHLGPEASLNTLPPHGFADYRIPFLQTKKTTRNPITMFGSNGGMFHVLDASVGTATSGREIFAYVPRSQYGNLSQLTAPAYVHRYFVDGPVVEGDVWNGTEWRTIAIGATGGGAPGIFAFDITTPDPASSTGGISLLWDNIPSDPIPGLGNYLGNIFQPGVIGSIRDSSAANGRGRWVYIVGNGFESGSNEAALLIFDALTGLLVKRIDGLGGTAANPNGLGAITPLYDGGRNIVAVYAGDKLGNLWKFNLSSPDKTQWASALGTVVSPLPLFQATDAGGVAQPITTAPRITPHPQGGLYVTFGTGKLFEVGDPTDMQVHSLYALRDRSPTATILKTSLQRIRLEQFDLDGDAATPDDVFRQLNGADVTAFNASQGGFYIPLINTSPGGTADGERVIASPILDSGVLAVTTFSPTSLGDRCVPGGVSFLYRFDLSGGFTQVAFGGQGAAVVGRRVSPGSVGGLPPLYDSLDPSGLPPVHTMDEAQVKAMLNNPKYKMSGNQAVQQGLTGVCAHVGLRVDGTIARIPTVCAGLMPLRSWRPVR
jgi:type IV pilus assembly protein PilY1